MCVCEREREREIIRKNYIFVGGGRTQSTCIHTCLLIIMYAFENSNE